MEEMEDQKDKAFMIHIVGVTGKDGTQQCNAVIVIMFILPADKISVFLSFILCHYFHFWKQLNVAALVYFTTFSFNC